MLLRTMDGRLGIREKNVSLFSASLTLTETFFVDKVLLLLEKLLIVYLRKLKLKRERMSAL